MSPETVRELWVRYVSGEALPAADQAALVAALDADPALRAELLEDVQVDGALRALGDARRSGDAFAGAVAECIEPERDATRFVRKVEATLAGLPPEPTGVGRDSRTNLPRLSRRFHRRDGADGGGGWRAALAAACALFAVLLISMASSSKPSRPSKAVPVVFKDLPAPAPKSTETVREERRVVAPAPKRSVEPGPEFRDPQPFEVPAPKGPDAVAAKPEAPPVAVPSPAPTRSAEEAAIARGPKIVAVVDQVYFAKGQTRVPVGAVLEYGQDLYTRGRGKATLRYDDGTTVVVGQESMVRDLSGAGGRRLVVSVGDVASDIQPQPAGQPMIFSTPHAEATIVGTRIRLTAGKDASVGTTLDVDEGKVRFLRLADRAAADVGAGQTSTASASLRDLKPRISFPDEFTVRFAPSDAPKAKDVYVDSGAPFSASLGYGWDGSRDGQLVPNAKQPSGGPVIMGRTAVWKMDPLDPRMVKSDPKTSSIAAGWGEHAETWRIELPNGRYLVSVCVGDYTFEQGPHHVAIEGRQIVHRVMTKVPKPTHLVLTEEVEVTDGELNMKVGGYTALQKSVDTSKDTLINYLVIKRVPAK